MEFYYIDHSQTKTSPDNTALSIPWWIHKVILWPDLKQMCARKGEGSQPVHAAHPQALHQEQSTSWLLQNQGKAHRYHPAPLSPGCVAPYYLTNETLLWIDFLLI